MMLTLTSLSIRAQYTVIDDTLRTSDIYPGTVHTLRVTVPDAYSPENPAPLYLGLDGVLCRAPFVLDSLQNAGVLRPTIGVFLQPGIVFHADGSVARYNRSNEFDATDDRFVTFLEQEVLPAVEKLQTADGRRIRLSHVSAERMIFGLSSGGIAAFNAAWHRPDLFGKVYSGCGTFVPMRGGNDIQAIVRKHEPKPLRIYLQDGYDDSWNPLFGSWYEANRMLGSALEFAGYDCAFDWAPGDHSVVRTSQIFPQVMKWMFRDGYDAINIGATQNNMLAPMLVEGADWEVLSTDTPATNGVTTENTGKSADTGAGGQLTAMYPDSTLAVTVCEGTNFLYQHIMDAHGNLTCGQRYYWLHTYDNSQVRVADMFFDGDGNLWVLTNAGIQICDQNGRVRGILDLPAAYSERMTMKPGVNSVTVTTPGAIYTREFNLKPAIPGKRPASQGQG